MNDPLPDRPPPTLIHAAERRAAALRLLLVHGIAFVAVNGVMLIVDLIDGDDLTAHRALLGWGIGLAVHAAVVLIDGHPIERWERRQADRLVADAMARQGHRWVVEPTGSAPDPVDPIDSEPRTRS